MIEKKEAKTSIFIIFILIVILLISSGQMGCPKKEAIEFNTTALTMSFVEDAPPVEMVPAETYFIYVDIANKGGADITAGAHFYLSGFSPETLQNVNTQVQNAHLLVKETAMQEGGKERLIFATAAKPAVLQAAFPFSMQIDACYKYNSAMQTSVCVGETGPVCTIEEEKISTGDNSAAPLQVTSLTQHIEGNKLFVTAVIENKGVGHVYLPDVNCDLLVLKDDINEKLKKDSIQIAVTTETDFKCSLKTLEAPHAPIEATSGILELSYGSGTLHCYKILSGEPTHTSPFSIATSYMYRQTASKNFKILPP